MQLNPVRTAERGQPHLSKTITRFISPAQTRLAVCLCAEGGAVGALQATSNVGGVGVGWAQQLNKRGNQSKYKIY